MTCSSYLYYNYCYFCIYFCSQTQYTISASVKPPANQELCRAGTLCTLNLFIQSSSSNGTTVDQSGDSGINVSQSEASVNQSGDSNTLPQLMYQVEVDTSMWALCGRSKGVVAMPTGQEVREVMLEVMPQTPGNLPVPLVKLCKYLRTEQGMFTFLVYRGGFSGFFFDFRILCVQSQDMF